MQKATHDGQPAQSSLLLWARGRRKDKRWTLGCGIDAALALLITGRMLHAGGASVTISLASRLMLAQRGAAGSEMRSSKAAQALQKADRADRGAEGIPAFASNGGVGSRPGKALGMHLHHFDAFGASGMHGPQGRCIQRMRFGERSEPKNGENCHYWAFGMHIFNLGMH